MYAYNDNNNMFIYIALSHSFFYKVWRWENKLNKYVLKRCLKVSSMGAVWMFWGSWFQRQGAYNQKAFWVDAIIIIIDPSYNMPNTLFLGAVYITTQVIGFRLSCT